MLTIAKSIISKTRNESIHRINEVFMPPHRLDGDDVLSSFAL